MPTSSLIPVEFVRYHQWANLKVFDACAGLSDDQLATSAPGAYGTIRETLEHIVRADSYYVSLFIGQRPQPPFQWEDKPSLAEVRAFAREVGEMLIRAAERATPDDVFHEKGDSSRPAHPTMPLWIQVINHGVEHRTNITTILSQLGMEGISDDFVDGWAYLISHPEKFGAYG